MGSSNILLSVDYMIWTEKVKDLVVSLSEGRAGEIWVTGALSEIAHSELEKLGWEIHIEAKKQLFPNKD